MSRNETTQRVDGRAEDSCEGGSSPGARRRLQSVTTAAIAIAGLLLSGCTSAPATVEQQDDAEVSVERPAAPEGELPADLQSQLQASLEQTMTDYQVPGAVAGVWIPNEGS